MHLPYHLCGFIYREDTLAYTCIKITGEHNRFPDEPTGISNGAAPAGVCADKVGDQRVERRPHDRKRQQQQ